VKVTAVVENTAPEGDAVIEMVGVTFGVTVTDVPEETAVHPAAFVPVTEYVPDDVTVMEEAVAPLLQR
jgi:uncharacterized phosphosugar-binding protein